MELRDMIESGIYKITNTCNGKFYIGSSVGLKRRREGHINLLRKNKHRNKHIQSAFNKYGEENFKFEVIEHVEDKEKLLEREQYWIDSLNVCNPKIGYNMLPTAGSSFGYKLSEKTKEKIRQANLGKKLSKECRDKLVNSRKKKVLNLTTGEIFDSMTDASIAYKIKYVGICNCCNKKQKTSAGCQWEYL